MNASDESKIKKQESKMKLESQQEIGDLTWLLDQPQFRRYVWKLMTVCGVYRSSAHQSGSWTYFNEGERSIGLRIINGIMETKPESYLEMILENKKEEKNVRASASRSTTED